MGPKTKSFPRARATAVLGLVVLAVLPAFFSGCLFSSDDRADQGALVIRAALQSDSAADAGYGSQGVGICPEISEMVDDLENLSAHAIIQRTHPRLPGESAVSGEGDLTVAPGASDSELLLTGEIEFEFGPAGSNYDLVVELFYQGRELEGAYAGTLSLESGIEVTVESLEIGALTPVAGQPGVFTATTVRLCVSSEGVDDDGIPGPDVFCTDEEDIEDEGMFYDRAANELSYEYLRSDVEWDATGELRDIVTRLRARLGRTAIYRGKGRILGIVPGLPEPVEVEIATFPVQGSGPGSLGEPLIGDIFLGFADGEPPTERGRFVLSRASSACPD